MSARSLDIGQVLSLHVYGPRSRHKHINSQKKKRKKKQAQKEQGAILTEQAWSIKGLL